jgi:hypothetical protein
MITEIGIVAGEIWHYLDEHGASPMNAIADGIERSRASVLMSIGWLAREGHVCVKGREPDFQVELREP